MRMNSHNTSDETKIIIYKNKKINIGYDHNNAIPVLPHVITKLSISLLMPAWRQKLTSSKNSMLVAHEVQKKTQFFSAYYFTGYNGPLYR